jgi:hypothetical protein
MIRKVADKASFRPEVELVSCFRDDFVGENEEDGSVVKQQLKSVKF